jgi:hypothetical protein
MKATRAGKNTVKNPVATRPGRNGGTLRSGGTNKGGPGRPRDEFRELMRALVSSEEAIESLRELIADPTSPHHMRAREYATERGYGKEAQAVDTTVRDVSYVIEVPPVAASAEEWARQHREREKGSEWARQYAPLRQDGR